MWGFLIKATTLMPAAHMRHMHTWHTLLPPTCPVTRRVEVWGFLIKATMACMCVFITNLKWLSVCLGVCALLLVLLYLRWVPHMYDWTNYLRVASYTAVLYACVCLVFLRCGGWALMGGGASVGLCMVLGGGVGP